MLKLYAYDSNFYSASQFLYLSIMFLWLRLSVSADKKAEGRSRVDRDADNLQLQQLEEKDVVSSVATVLSDLCGPGEWMAMEKLHTEVSSDHCFFYAPALHYSESHNNGRTVFSYFRSGHQTSESYIEVCILFPVIEYITLVFNLYTNSIDLVLH